MRDIKPVFITGTGRCGSQIFYRMMAYHKSLRGYTRMGKIIDSYRTINMNFKWKKNISSKEKKVLQDSLKDTLQEYGYEV
ncbi:MAG: hypothetical protein R6W73_05195 [Candidatus Saliniplasma sp.]